MLWNGPYGINDGRGSWGWLWPFHFLVPLLFLGLIVALVVVLVRYAMGWGGHPTGHSMMMGCGTMGHELERRRPPGLDVLDERYARGEIDRDEYLEKKRDITG